MMEKYYTLINPEPKIPVVANIPHSSAFIPDFARAGFTVSPEFLNLESARLVDWFTDELYTEISARGGCSLVYGANRLVLDPERYEDDAQEIMTQVGMGVIYTHGTHKEVLRETIAPEHREELLAKLYRPYHAEMEARVRWVVENFGRCLVLDCHSFPERVLPYELDQNAPRPAFCFGTDKIHTPEPLVRAMEAVVAKQGLSTFRNKPFGGTVLPLAFYKDTRVSALMIEINRGLYMDEKTTQKSDGFARTKAIVDELVRVAEQTF